MSKFIVSTVKSLDSFGKPLGFSYKDKETFTTIVGGVVTIISKLLLLAYICLGLKDVYLKKNNIINKTLYKDLAVDLNGVYLTQ